MNKFIKLAIDQAKRAKEENEVPVGAVIIDDKNNIISMAHNLVEKYNNPTMHAEILAINEACKILKQKYLNNCKIFVSLEPCPMCAQAISFAKLSHLYYSAYDIKQGGVDNGAKIFNAKSCHHKPEIIGGILETESTKLLTDFFKEKRNEK